PLRPVPLTPGPAARPRVRSVLRALDPRAPPPRAPPPRPPPPQAVTQHRWLPGSLPAPARARPLPPPALIALPPAPLRERRCAPEGRRAPRAAPRVFRSPVPARLRPRGARRVGRRAQAGAARRTRARDRRGRKTRRPLRPPADVAA